MSSLFDEGLCLNDLSLRFDDDACRSGDSSSCLADAWFRSSEEFDWFDVDRRCRSSRSGDVCQRRGDSLLRLDDVPCRRAALLCDESCRTGDSSRDEWLPSECAEISSLRHSLSLSASDRDKLRDFELLRDLELLRDFGAAAGSP